MDRFPPILVPTLLQQKSAESGDASLLTHESNIVDVNGRSFAARCQDMACGHSAHRGSAASLLSQHWHPQKENSKGCGPAHLEILITRIVPMQILKAERGGMASIIGLTSMHVRRVISILHASKICMSLSPPASHSAQKCLCIY